MTDEKHSETSNGHSHLNEWEADISGELEDEWRQITSGYSSPEASQEWESPNVSANQLQTIHLPVNREAEVPKVRRIIAHCKQMALPVALEILEGSGSELPAFSSRESINQLFSEFEELLSASEKETEALETESLGNDEFNAVLAATELAHDLALTETLAAEAIHSQSESEVQSLLSTALPISASIMGAGSNFNRIIPALTQSNARLVSTLFHSGPLSRRILATLPAIQRRAVSSLQTAQNKQMKLTPNLINRIFAAQAAKVLLSPATLGKALIRNRAIRNTTMPKCSKPI